MDQSKYAAGGIIPSQHQAKFGDDAHETIIPLSETTFPGSFKRVFESNASKNIATQAKDLHDKLVEQFGDDDRVMDMVIAAMPSISEEAYRPQRPSLFFSDTAESIEESLKIDDDYVPSIKVTVDAEEKKKALKTLARSIFNPTSSKRRKCPL